MGKHTRRKNRKQNKGNYNNKGGARNNSNNNNNDNSKKNTTIMRIRHGDARVRHGALTALSSTIFSPDVLSNTQKGCTDELIKALGERVMHDPDVPCAIIAAGCLSNYSVFGNADASSSSGSSVKIGPILLARIDRCYADIVTLYGNLDEVNATVNVSNEKGTLIAPGSTSMAENESANKKHKGKKDVKGAADSGQSKRHRIILALEEQWSLTCVCLRALCGLIERGSQDDDDILVSALSINDNKLITSLMLVISSVEAALKRATTASTKIADENIEYQEMVKKAASEASIIALRTFHAALDDDLPLLRCLLRKQTNVIPALINLLRSDLMPPLALLHASGCIVVIRQSLPSLADSPDVASDAAAAILGEIQAACVQSVLPLLNQTLVFDTAVASPLIVKLCEAAKAAAEEAEDEKIERDAVRATTERREPARLIARRQKLAKEEKERNEEKDKMMTDAKAENTIADSGVAMMEEENKNNDNDDQKMDTDDNKKEDKREAYENVCNEWTNFCLPLKLGLEITTNLCASSSSLSEYGEDDDMMMGDAHEIQDKECHPLDKDLRKSIANTTLIDHILGLIGMLRCALHTKCTNGSDKVPELVLEEISEILSKVAACLGNALSNLPEWRESNKEMGEVWTELRGIVVASSQKSLDIQEQALQEMATAAACNSMAAMLRSRPVARSFVGDEDLSLIIGLLENENDGNGKTTPMDEPKPILKETWKTDSQRDAVAMLGVLCSEPHSDAINDRICSALLAVLQRVSSSCDNIAVANESYDVLMDMYGGDDDDPNSHSGVFRSKNVLSYFETAIPAFERKIEKMASEIKGRGGAITEEDLDVWRETAMNASRFVEYKKGLS